MVVGDKWEFKTLDELHVAANIVLKTAMMNERRKRWNKVVESYSRLLWLIDKKHFPADYEPPSNYNMLLYELYYHLGVALQKTGNHKKAVKQLSLAIDVVSLAKNGCQAGCVNNSCLMTPLYARRAFANTKAGNSSSAKKDAEKAVVLDSHNPDVYCIRALVFSSQDDDKHAMKDLDKALTINPNHLCALVVRGALARPVTEVVGKELVALKSEDHIQLARLEGRSDSYSNDELCKAGKLNPDSKPFHTITDFHHPSVLDFYDRFLYSLGVPHTITVIDLKPDKPSQKAIVEKLQQKRQPSDTSRPTSAASTVSPIRAGTPTPAEYNRLSTRRRYDYGEAIRKHNSRPRTASEFFAQLERERMDRREQEHRPNTTRSLSITSLADTPRSESSETLTNRTPRGTARSQSTDATKLCRPKTFEFPAATKYVIPVFQTMNVQNAPRIYYKPWKGDKLPVADLPKRRFSPAFY